MLLVFKVFELGNKMLGEEMDTISHDGEAVTETGNGKRQKWSVRKND